MPIADDASTPAPTKPTKPAKKKPPVKRTFIGPTASTSIGPIASSKLPPSRPVKAPSAPIKATAPTYVTDIKRSPLKVADTRAFAPEKDTSSITETIYNQREKVRDAVSKSSNDLGDFLQGLKTSGRGIETPEAERNPLLVEGLDSYQNSEQKELQEFLKKVQPSRPENYDPEYGGLVMPERWKHRGRNLKNPLKPYWDEDFITKFLGVESGENDPNDPFGRSQIKANMNDILYQQLQTQGNWIRKRTRDRADKVVEFLDDAGQDAFDGDFTTLAKKLEDNPNFLEFAKYKDDFTKSPQDIMNEWFQNSPLIKDPYLKTQYRKEARFRTKHLEYAKSNYSKARQYVNDAVKRYEERYDDSVEFNDIEDAGPAVPNVAAKAAKDKAEQQALSDLIGDQGDSRDHLAGFYGGVEGKRRVLKEKRTEAKDTLGVTDLPTVKEMLSSLVANGQVDPKNQAEVTAWIRRLKNPNHPDTRAMYVSFARTVNKDLDVKTTGLEYINAPLKEYVKSENERAVGNAKAAQEGSENTKGLSISFIRNVVSDPVKISSSEGVSDLVGESIKSIKESDRDAISGMEWTFDKLSRLNYAVSGTAGAMYALDEDKVKGKPWFNAWADPISLYTGRSWYDSLDEIYADPSKIKDVAQEGYSQLLRGSGLPGVKKVVPSTFSRVIAESALSDGSNDFYDNEWYQHIAGFGLDVTTDPLNFIGVGVVDDTLKISARAAKKLSRSDKISEYSVDSADFLKALNNPNMGPAAEKAWRRQQVEALLGDEIETAGVQLVRDSDNTVPFSVQFTNDEPSYMSRAQRKMKPAARVETRYDPNYDTDTLVSIDSINAQRAELTALKKSVTEQMGMSHYTTELNKLADELDILPASVPQLPVQRLMARTSKQINQKNVSESAVHLDAPGSKFYTKIIEKLNDQDVIRDWEGRTSTTKFATVKDQDGTRLTSKAAAAKRAVDEEEAAYAYASERGLNIEDIVPQSTRDWWAKAIDEAGNTDEVTGKPAMWQNYDVDPYLDAGAPGLLDGSFNPYEEFATASGDAVAFKATFSETDVLKALYHGPRMHADTDEVASAALNLAQKRIRDSRAKLKATEGTTDPKIKKVREATYQALALGLKEATQHSLAGAFRYLDTVKASRNAGETFAHTEDIKHLDELRDKAASEFEKAYDPNTANVGDYYGSFGTDAKGDVSFSTDRAFEGTYEGYDFTGKSFSYALNDVDASNFQSRATQIQSMMDAISAQKAELLAVKGGKPFALTPVEAQQVDRMLGPKSQFRKADGTVDANKVTRHLTHNRENFDDKTPFKVSYRLQKPSADNAAAMARYTREVRFLESVAKFVEDRANLLFREEKTALVKAQSAPDEAVEDFWKTVGDRKVGPAEWKLGPKPKKLDDISSLHGKTGVQERSRKTAAEVKRSGEREFIEVTDPVTMRGQKVNDDNAVPRKFNGKAGMAPAAKTAGQRRAEAALKGAQRRWEKAVLRAREIDAEEFKKLKADRAPAVEGFRLTAKQTQTVYQTAYKRAIDEVANDINAGVVKSVNANAVLSIGDQAKILEQQLANELKYRELQLKVQEAEATNIEQLRAIEHARKNLTAQKRQLTKKIKTIRFESNAVKATMKVRITEDHIFQAMMMPERVDARMLQLRMLGMRKNLQFTHNMFNGMELVEKLLPTTVYTNFANNWVRPSKQLNQPESIALRAKWESKTPVVVRSNLERLTKAMQNTTESERAGILLAIRKGIPYGGAKQVEYHAIKSELDNVMKIINGAHEQYMFTPISGVKAEALTLSEITRFLPKEYNFDPKVLFRLEGQRLNSGVKGAVAKNLDEPYGSYVPEGMDAKVVEREWAVARSASHVTIKQLQYLRHLGADPFKVAKIRGGSRTNINSQVDDYIKELKENPPLDRNSSISAPVSSNVADPFSGMPEAWSNATIDDLLNAIEVNGATTPKDLSDPFRVAWVYSLAADQASQLRGFKKSIAETFGAVRPQNPAKVKVWRELKDRTGWQGHPAFVDGFGRGVEVFFPPEIVNEVDKLLKLTEPGPESWAISKMFDEAIGYWKQGMTIYNPAYYTRNGIGEMMVAWLDGVNSPKWYRMAHQIHRYEKKSGQELSELIKKFDGLKGKVVDESVKGNEVLFTLKGGEKVRVEDALMWYIETGMKSTFVNTDLAQGVRGLASATLTKNPLRKAGSKVNETVHEAGEGFEDWLRMSHFLHAMQNSGKGTLREAAQYAATRVRRSHFDYTDFSQMEKTVMMRAFPFYKWVRRGAPLMVAHLFMTPGKMAALPKALDTISGLGIDPLNAFNDDPILSTSDVLEDKNGHLPDYQGIAPAWVRDLFAYQVQPAEDDEYVNYLRINTPQIDGLQGLMGFGDSATSLAQGDVKGAIQGLGNSSANTLLNPLAKMPIELGMNRGLDPDNDFEIYGGEFNKNMGISDPEAIGAYVARNANPWSGFFAKLSKNGKLPDGLNISDQETKRDATRDIASFITGLGFYQASPEKEFKTTIDSDGKKSKSSAVGSLGLGDLTTFRGGPAASKVSNTKRKSAVRSIDKVIDKLKNAEESPTGGKKSGWIDYPEYKKSGRKWVDYPEYGGSGYSSGGGSSSWDLIALLQSLRNSIDEGRVIKPEDFEL